MLDTQSVTEKSPAREEKLRFRRLGSLRSVVVGFREFDAPDILLGLPDDADLIGFGGADLAHPDDSETGFAPEAADFDGLAGSG